MEDLQGRHMMRSVTFWRGLVLPLLSLLASSVIVAAAIRHLPFSDPSPALLSGLIATAVLTRVLLIVLPRMAQELQACDPSLRQLIIGLIAGGIVVAFFSAIALVPRPLTWQWGAGPQTGALATMFPAASWDGVNRSVVELHATNDPSTTPFGVWRAVASLDEAAGVQPAQAELWLTQPSWTIIDATTGRPPPTADGVDVVIGVQRGQELLLERRVALDPPATPEEGRWRHVTLNLPPGAERLVVEVLMRSTLDYDRVWITEAVVRPTWRAVIDRVALVLIVALGVSTLAFAGRMPPVISVSRRIEAFFSSYGYLLLGAACLWLAYLLVWRRGLYWDDWYMVSLGRDPLTLDWRPLPPIEQLLRGRPFTWALLPYLTALLLTDEFQVRLLMTACSGLNGFLLGWLVHRILRAKLPAMVAGWLFLVPNHIPLLTQTAGYVFMTGFVLLMLHAIWSTLVVDRFQYVWLLGGNLALLIAMMWYEAPVGIVSVVPIMGIICCAQQPKARWRTIVYRTVLSIATLTAITASYAFLVINSSYLVKTRGLTTDISTVANLAKQWLAFAYRILIDPSNPTSSYHYMILSHIVGLRHLLLSSFGIILLSGISAIFVLVVVSWKDCLFQSGDFTQALLVLVLGIVWFLTSFFLPYVFAPAQGFAIYLMYFPASGVCIALGALVALIASVVRIKGIQQAIAGIFGLLLIMLSICMVGTACLYQARYESDREVFVALARLVPPEAISDPVQFIPVNLNFSLPGKENTLSPFLDSAFEEYGAARGAFTIVYSDKIERYIQYIATPRWYPATFSERISDKSANPCLRFVSNADILVVQSATLFVQGCPVDPERAIVFTHHNGELALVRTLTLQRSDGTTRIIELPVVSRLAARGSTVIETMVIPVED